MPLFNLKDPERIRPGQLGSLTLPTIQLMPVEIEMQCDIDHTLYSLI